MQQPATVIVPPPQVVVPAQSGGCSCAVPANTSGHVKGARGSVIAAIVIHAVSMIAFGFYFWTTWIASLITFIMGGIQLCQFTKCCYMVAGSLYIVGCILDLVSMAAWIAVGQAIDDGTSGEYDGWENLAWLALPAALGAITLLIASIYTFLAVCHWEKSGAPDAMGMAIPAAGPQVVMPPGHVQTTHGKAQPPPYANV